MAFLTEQDKQYVTPVDICAHVGDEYGKFMGAIVPPIFQNSLFGQAHRCERRDPDRVRLYPGQQPHHRHRRAQDRGPGGRRRRAVLLLGHGAISSAIMHFVSANCQVGSVATSYGCTLNFIKNYLHNKFGSHLHLGAWQLGGGNRAGHSAQHQADLPGEPLQPWCSICRIWRRSPPWPSPAASARSSTTPTPPPCISSP